jgi:hypothetical protein
METYSIKQNSKSVIVEKYFLCTWTYSVVVLNILSFEIQDAFIKYNKNKPKMIRLIPAATKTKLWNKEVLNFCKKISLLNVRIKNDCLWKWTVLKKHKGYSDNFEYIFTLHESFSQWWKLVLVSTVLHHHAVCPVDGTNASEDHVTYIFYHKGEKTFLQILVPTYHTDYLVS